jgi:two-component system, LytTR family, response regulator AlgR
MIPRLFIVDDEAPARTRLTTLLADIAVTCPHQLVGQAEHAQNALEGIARTKPDIVLLDVQMPGMNGIELATLLAKASDKPPSIIFITAYEEYAIRAFDVHALDYLLKPVRATRLEESLLRVVALRMQDQSRHPTLTIATPVPQPVRQQFPVQERGRLLLISVTDVLYCKAELKYVTLHTKTRDYVIEESLLSIEEEMAATFVRVHRNTLVARNAIIGVERGLPAYETTGETEKMQECWQVILRDTSERLPISRRQWAVIKALVR